MSAESMRFAQAVLARFRELGLGTDEEIKNAGGPSTSTMTKIRAAAKDVAYSGLTRPRGDSAARIDAAARWMPRSARALWDGKEPSALPPEESGALHVIMQSTLPEWVKRDAVRVYTSQLLTPPDEADKHTEAG